jgi:uncharacterized protein
VTFWELALVALAGVGAGFINAVAGSGTLITFPTLLALGVPPVTANVSNNVGLVPGGVSGAIGWRRELRGQAPRALRLASASALGAVAGSILLLALPPEAFAAIVPVLVAGSLLLVVFQKRIARRAEEIGHEESDAWWLWPGVALAGVYGGYFGAAQGIMLVALLGVGAAGTLHRHNAIKNVLSALVNAVAAVVFVVVAEIDWVIAGVIAGGSVVGAQLGSAVGRRMPAEVLRGTIVVVASAALVVFLLRD